MAIDQGALQNIDWVQVVLNGGPPCFHLEEDGRFCLRAEKWSGHHVHHVHKFVSLAAYAAECVRVERERIIEALNAAKLRCSRCKERVRPEYGHCTKHGGSHSPDFGAAIEREG